MVNLYEKQIFRFLKWAQECAPDALSCPIQTWIFAGISVLDLEFQAC